VQQLAAGWRTFGMPQRAEYADEGAHYPLGVRTTHPAQGNNVPRSGSPSPRAHPRDGAPKSWIAPHRAEVLRTPEARWLASVHAFGTTSFRPWLRSNAEMRLAHCITSLVELFLCLMDLEGIKKNMKYFDLL
jgi:hypothetical protein